MSKQTSSIVMQKLQANRKILYVGMLAAICSLISFTTLAQNQPSSEKVKINIGVEDLYIDIGVEDFYINIGVEDCYHDIGISDLFSQLGVATVAQPDAETGVKFDKGYILAKLKDVKPGQHFAGIVKDVGKLEKVCSIQGVKNGSQVEILYNEKGKFRLSFPDQSPKRTPTARD